MWPDERNTSLTNFKDDVGMNAKSEDLEMWTLDRSGEDVSKFHFEDRTSRFSTQIEGFDWLYLGNAENAASKVQMLNYPKHKMTHCLNCRMNGSTPFKGTVKYKVLKLVDEPAEDLVKQVNIAYDFIDSARKEGGKILVHCDGEYSPQKKRCSTNQSRSTAILAGYLMKAKKIKYKDADKIIQSSRKKMYQKPSKPNHGFIQQLTKMQKRL